MGPKFALPVKYSAEEITEFRSAKKAILQAHGLEHNRHIIDNLIESALEDLVAKRKWNRTPSERYFLESIEDLKSFFNQHQNIMVAESDKGKSAVILTRQDYIEKIESLLADSEIYTRQNASSLRSYIRLNERMLNRAIELGVASYGEAKAAMASEILCPNIYGRVKTHKAGLPLRPIVNTRGSPGYFLNQIMLDHWTEFKDKSKYNVKNSACVVDILKHIRLLPEDKFFSIDVVSMFTSINPIEAKGCIRRKIEKHKQQKMIEIGKIPGHSDEAHTQRYRAKQALLAEDEISNFLLEAYGTVNTMFTELQFGDTNYKQKKGFKMGSSISALITDFYMEEILDAALAKLPVQRPKVLVKYVDDLLLVCPKETAELLLKILNASHRDLEFTLEEEKDGKLAYLDFEINRTSSISFSTKWYAKPMSSDRILNWNSNHDSLTIRNTGFAFVKNMKGVSSPIHHPQMRKKAYDLLISNGYPRSQATSIVSRVFAPDGDKTLTKSQKRSIKSDIVADNKAKKRKDQEIASQQMIEQQIAHAKAKKAEQVAKRRYAVKALPHIPMIARYTQKIMKNVHPNLTIPTTPIRRMRNEVYLPQRKNKNFISHSQT